MKWFFAAEIAKISTQETFTPAFAKPMLAEVFLINFC